MTLIDAYAEARHVGGCHTYNVKTAEARAKVAAQVAALTQPAQHSSVESNTAYADMVTALIDLVEAEQCVENLATFADTFAREGARHKLHSAMSSARAVLAKEVEAPTLRAIQPNDTATGPEGVWYCEAHPDQLMGHGGCGGAGIPACARIGMLMNQLRLTKQEVREANRMRDEMAAAARRAQAISAEPAGATQEPVAFIHWPINGPPRLGWYSQKALNDAILKTYEGHQPDVKLYTPQAAQQAPARATPSEPSHAMYAAAQKILIPTGGDDGWSIMLNTSQVRALWQSMLSVAPAAHSTPASGGWMPVETAPKGELVILSRPKDKPCIDDWGRYCRVNQPKFSHWMPLPASPTIEGESK